MTQIRKIFVKDPRENFKYPIFIGTNILDLKNKLIFNEVKGKQVYILYDEFFHTSSNKSLKLLDFSNSLRFICSDIKLIKIKSRDKNKNFSNLEKVLENLLKQKISRNSIIIAFGGGVIGDLAGFAAAILLRGIKFIQIPTTLLAQVDSSVGGKTGINSSHGKNLIGSFHQPEAVIIDTYFLKTLPKRELHAGIAEIIKYSLIQDKRFFHYLDNYSDEILNLESKCINYIIYKSCFIKAGIVAKDEKENGIRAILNLGHTFGHAFESILNYDDRLIHGEAVAIGMCMAFRFSNKLGFCKEDEVAKIETLISKYNLPTTIKLIANSKFNSKQIIEKLYKDKKVKNGRITFILPKGIGQCFIKDNIDKKVILEFLTEEINA